MPLIPADHVGALGAVIFALAWLGFWIDRQPIASRIPGVPWVIGAGLLLSNTGVIPTESPAFGFVGQYLLPLGVALLLFKANLRAIFTQGGWVLPAFLMASVGLCVGAIGGSICSISARRAQRSRAPMPVRSSVASSTSWRFRRP